MKKIVVWHMLEINFYHKYELIVLETGNKTGYVEFMFFFFNVILYSKVYSGPCQTSLMDYL